MTAISRARSYNLDFRVVGLAFVLWFVLGFGVGVVHEAGHALICVAEGYRAQVWFDGSGGHTLCSGNPANDFLYSIGGPAFGALAMIVPLTIIRLRKRWLTIPLGAWSIDQGLKLFLEPIGDSPYFLMIFVMQISSLIGLALLVGIRDMRKSSA